jgi:hypothetical protein
MSHSNYQEKMDFEIDKRLNSAEWGLDIASEVISARNRKIKKNIFSFSSLSLLATAAAIVVVFFIIPPSSKVNDLDLFIAEQVNGTHKEVFNNDYSENMLQANSIENKNGLIYHLVDTALSMR